jgi:predicted dehydrogenase
MKSISRRSFLRTTSKGITGLSVAAVLSNRVHGANEKLQVGVIGLRTQGTIVAKSFIKTGRAEVAAVCDVDQEILESRAAEIESAQGRKIETFGDFRRVLERTGIDAVIVATPDHWHAIMAILACQAGKDVYLEKPCAHNVHECGLIVRAAQKYGRVIQHGTMQRSGAHFQEAREYIRSGKLGKIALVHCHAILGRAGIGHKPVSDPPAHLNYDFWLGPAPYKPFNENRCHYNWRFMWDYGTGDMGNWGVHWLDMPLWMMDLTWPDAVSSSGGKFVYDDDKEVPDTQMALYEYPGLTLTWELRMWSKAPNQGGIADDGTGVTFYGDQQRLVLNRSGWKAYAKDEPEVVAQGNARDDKFLLHAANFIDCVRTRKPPVSDIASGQISSAVSLLGNVALLSGEKIRYNPRTNQLDKPEHNHLLTRTYREKWQFPKV